MEDGALPDSLRQAAKVHVTHGERDARRIFRRFSLDLKVPIDNLLVGPCEDGEYVNIPHYKVEGQMLVEHSLH